jgi:hypothetical protein
MSVNEGAEMAQKGLLNGFLVVSLSKEEFR